MISDDFRWFQMISDDFLVGGWYPYPLKNDGVSESQLGL